MLTINILYPEHRAVPATTLLCWYADAKTDDDMADSLLDPDSQEYLDMSDSLWQEYESDPIDIAVEYLQDTGIITVAAEW